MTERQFFDALQKKGYEIKIGKDISLRPPGKERFVRLVRNFGEDYSIAGIRTRILQQRRPERPLPVSPPKKRYQRCRDSFRKAKKITGFRALYFHYCYLLGVFPKKKSQNKRRLHFLLREDLIKLDAITKEVRLLAEHRIDTAEQLSSYKSELESKIGELTADRKQLYRKQRTVAVKSDEDLQVQVKTQINVISGQLKRLREEVRLCDDIARRSGVMQEKIEAVRKDEKTTGKEKTRYEQFR